MFPGQDAEAVACLPDSLGSAITDPDAQRVTGTDGKTEEVLQGHMRGQYSLKSLQDVTGICEPDTESRKENDESDASPNVSPYKD